MILRRLYVYIFTYNALYVFLKKIFYKTTLTQEQITTLAKNSNISDQYFIKQTNTFIKPWANITYHLILKTTLTPEPITILIETLAKNSNISDQYFTKQRNTFIKP